MPTHGVVRNTSIIKAAPFQAIIFFGKNLQQP